MNNTSFTSTFTVDQPANEVFNAVNNISKWWTENMKGDSRALNDEFTVQFEDIHFSKQRLTEFVPDEKIVWLVTDSRLNFLQNKQEWTGTQIVFEISGQGNKTQLRFTHIGLSPDVECYNACTNAWSQYFSSSLYKLITTGKGEPEKAA